MGSAGDTTMGPPGFTLPVPLGQIWVTHSPFSTTKWAQRVTPSEQISQMSGSAPLHSGVGGTETGGEGAGNGVGEGAGVGGHANVRTH